VKTIIIQGVRNPQWCQRKINPQTQIKVKLFWHSF
jgi:hypothetical protein